MGLAPMMTFGSIAKSLGVPESFVRNETQCVSVFFFFFLVCGLSPLFCLPESSRTHACCTRNTHDDREATCVVSMMTIMMMMTTMKMK